MAIASQTDLAIQKSLNERKKHFPEYENWERIAKLNFELHQEGQHHPRP